MKNSRIATATAAALLVILAGHVSRAGSRDLSSVNGSVDATAGESYDTLSAVNGNVHVARGASAEVVKTVNGDVTLETGTKVGAATTVNGSLDIRDGAHVARTASTVNGTIALGREARIGGDVRSVSGEIQLSGADVRGQIETRNGDIRLRDGAKVHGGIHVQKPDDHGWGWNDKEDRVRVRICATCVVEGDLRFDRAVLLEVEPGARIGQVIGDDVQRR